MRFGLREGSVQQRPRQRATRARGRHWTLNLRLQAWPSAITLNDMGKRTAVYEVVDAATREALSRHRTRQAALDAWRLEFPGRRVRVERRGIPNEHVLIVEGVWHESIRRT
jgi:hypothetical protein